MYSSIEQSDMRHKRNKYYFKMHRVMLFLSTVFSICECYQPPHIIFILADDMGWNDVSFHGSPEIPTPNIDALAASGIVLQNYYAQSMCTPSRGSLMTGKYVIHTGLQHYVIHSAAPYGLPLQEKILPQFLKQLGYATHAIGKWHLGYCKKSYTPTHRGFDSFFGYWNGVIDYYDHTNYEVVKNVPGIKEVWGRDLHDGLDIASGYQGQYATDLFTEKARKIIDKHNTSKPLFLYLSHLAPHVGNPYHRMQAPSEYVNKFNYIKDVNRRIYAGVMSKLDESIGEIFQSLHSKDMLKNTIIVFSSDNGGEPEGYRGGHASNWPLRGVKMSMFEGGIKVPALVWSPLLKLDRPRVTTQLIHVTDWLPTLYTAAGGDIVDIGKIDGISMWDHLLNNTAAPRSEILFNIDPISGQSELIQGDLKLILGLPPDGKYSWYGPSGHENLKIHSMDDWIWKSGSVVKNILNDTQQWLICEPDTWRKNLSIRCGEAGEFRESMYSGVGNVYLYNLTKDPCEINNLAYLELELVASMMERLEDYNATAVKPLYQHVDPYGDPKCYGFAYVPWLDEEHKSECPYV